MKYESVKDDRQMRALTGLSISAFEEIVPEFSGVARFMGNVR